MIFFFLIMKFDPTIADVTAAVKENVKFKERDPQGTVLFLKYVYGEYYILCLLCFFH